MDAQALAKRRSLTTQVAVPIRRAARSARLHVEDAGTRVAWFSPGSLIAVEVINPFVVTVFRG